MARVYAKQFSKHNELSVIVEALQDTLTRYQNHLGKIGISQNIQTGRFQTRIALHSTIIDSFSDDELRDICLRLEIDYEQLPEGSLSNRVHSIITHIGHRNKTPTGEWDLSKLVEVCRELRPLVEWPELE